VILALLFLLLDDPPNPPQRHAPQPPSVTLIKPDVSEQLQFEIISLQQEVLRLTTCLKRNLTLEECGPWRNGQVMQIPKSKPQSANAGEPQPVENPEKSANKKEPEKSQP